MSNPLKKTMVYLGLAEEDLESEELKTSGDRQSGQAAAEQARPEASSKPSSRAAVTPLRRVTPTRQPSAGAMNEILTVHPTEYRDAPTIAESFRNGVPVIINLSRMTESDAKRLVDFASGLTMGLHGHIERVTNKVFLLSPEFIEIGGAGETETSAQNDTFFVAPSA